MAVKLKFHVPLIFAGNDVVNFCGSQVVCLGKQNDHPESPFIWFIEYPACAAHPLGKGILDTGIIQS